MSKNNMKQEDEKIVMYRKLANEEVETLAFCKMRRTRGSLIVKARGSIFGSRRTKKRRSRVKL